ncbi:unnamed protein product [Medioppia subpectinata]|uniref:Uncharacterized protein n=1 Tax=Medioppia subpectinata TaxID=1979941 RepID=A0A7R9PZN8_9ACAR|nr:unnamed protein product [Medioppia subpectinata]CAG2107166.1 unnamed protein product [Medioppia subpectinata]
MFNFNLIWLFVLNQNVDTITCECPDPSVILPYGCTGCQYNYIECYGNNDFDLAEMFNKLSLTLEPEQKHFHRFKFNNTKVTEIKANTFMDIVFVEIYISDSNLIHIHPDAFMYTYNTTNKFSITNNSQLEPDTMYAVMSKFANATRIVEINNAKFTMMPANAFSNIELSILQDLWIDSFETTIGSHAISINHIMSNAFAIDRPSNDSLVINLNACWLNETSFEPGSLIGINRPTTIWMQRQHGNIVYLPQKVFHPFYMENELNTIDLSMNNGFDCQDCRSSWLKNGDLFKRNRTIL